MCVNNASNTLDLISIPFDGGGDVLLFVPLLSISLKERKMTYLFMEEGEPSALAKIRSLTRHLEVEPSLRLERFLLPRVM